MAGIGSFDYSKLEEFVNNLESAFSADEVDKLMEACAKEIAARLLRKVRKRTPVGEYPRSAGKVGGTLRRGWSIGEISKEGDKYSIEVVNPIEYASYVEYGHRTRNHRGFVDGRFMLRISMQEIENISPKICERRILKKLKEVFE